MRHYPFFNIRSTQKLTVGTGAAVASTAAPGAGEYLLTADVAYYLAIGPAPVATTSSFYVPVGAVLPLSLANGEKVSLLGASAGSAWVTAVGVQ